MVKTLENNQKSKNFVKSIFVLAIFIFTLFMIAGASAVDNTQEPIDNHNKTALLKLILKLIMTIVMMKR